MVEKKGFIYIFTNESFHKSDWIKIGYTTDVQKRIKDLSSTSVPLPFEVYATYEVTYKGKMPDKALHRMLEKLNPQLKISPDREFYQIEPWDAYELLESIAIIHGDLDKLVRYKDNKYGSDEGGEEGPESIANAMDQIQSDSRLVSILEKIRRLVRACFPESVECVTKNYVSYKKDTKHNIVFIRPMSGWLELVLCAKRGQIRDESGLTYDISNRLWTNSQYAIRVNDDTRDGDIIGLFEQLKAIEGSKK